MTENFPLQLQELNVIIDTLRIFFINICTYYTAIKIMHMKNQDKYKIIINSIKLMTISVICYFIKYYFNYFNSIICQIVLIVVVLYKNTRRNIGYMLLIVLIALSINYGIFFISIVLSFFPNLLMKVENDFISLLSIIFIDIIILSIFLRMKKFKYGISFLQEKIENDYMDLLILNVSITILFTTIILTNSHIMALTKSLFIGLIIFIITMFVTIQKSLQLYYKQKLLEKEIEETKEQLEKKTKEVEELEAENLRFSKKSHTLAHKQKSLEYKLQEILSKSEISKEEAAEVRDRLKTIEKDLYKEKTSIALDKTEIPEIDDMLKYMQSECKKNKIDFELQLKGNIHYMINNLIPKEDLEKLLADHIKNAIIAINHTDNINRSILVRLGKIDENYGLYIYDSGIEFEPETLENLGKKPSTTHANEGGTGMGFMNTFDTLTKCKASLIIEEYNKPNKDNYTKAIIIKFDNKNEFKIKSYREKVVGNAL